MQLSRTFPVLALAVGALVIGSSHAQGLAQSETPAPSAPQVVRVLYLQDLVTVEATSLVRGKVAVSRVMEIKKRNALILVDGAEKVEQAEKLLRERGAIARTAEPHKPLELDRLAQSPPSTRVFRVAEGATKDAALVINFVYQAQDVKEAPTEHGISVAAPQSILDAAESLLRELGYLAASTSRP